MDDALRSRALDFAAAQRSQWAGEMSAQQLDEWQASAVAATLDYCAARSPFYSRRLDGPNLSTTGNAGRDAASLLRDIPFTTKADLREQLDDVACLPLGESWVYYETTGTTGVSTPCPRTAEDSVRTAIALCAGYGPLLENYGKHHAMAVLGPTELHSTGDTFGDVFRSLGHATVKLWPHSPLVGFGRARALLQRLDVSGMVCTPGMAIALARSLQANGVRPRDIGVRVILTVGELATPSLLEAIAQTWQADVHSCMYASQEASILAVCRPDGRLRSTPLNYFYEIVDPATGRPLTGRSPHRQGEMVVTHLYQGAKPLVRYRTGDLVIADGAGQDFTVTPVGRVGDAITVGGSAFTAHAFEEVVLSKAPHLLDYQVELTSSAGRDELHVVFEALEPAGCVSLAAYERSLSDALGVAVRAEWGPTDAKTSTGAMVSWKAARVADRREATDTTENRSAQRIAAQRERAASAR